MGIQFTHSEASRCRSRSKNGQYYSSSKPRVMDLCAVLLKRVHFHRTARKLTMTIAVIAGPSYVPRFTISPCFPVASERSSGET